MRRRERSNPLAVGVPGPSSDISSHRRGHQEAGSYLKAKAALQVRGYTKSQKAPRGGLGEEVMGSGLSCGTGTDCNVREVLWLWSGIPPSGYNGCDLVSQMHVTVCLFLSCLG
jgi:hypothetical protein